MNKPRLLDLFCGAGGAAMGYSRAGFDVTGVDIAPMKRYPFQFIQADALEYLSEHGREYDVIHASPPCQAYSVTRSMHSNNYPDLVNETRLLLLATGKPYVIENVPGAPLQNPLMLCGTMFGLRVIRHRLFECRPPIWFPPAACNHWGKATGSGSARNGEGGTNSIESSRFDFVTVVGNDYLADEGRVAMGIDWMVKKELSQAIPPAYTEFIGRHMMKYITEADCEEHTGQNDNVFWLRLTERSLSFWDNELDAEYDSIESREAEAGECEE